MPQTAPVSMSRRGEFLTTSMISELLENHEAGSSVIWTSSKVSLEWTMPSNLAMSASSSCLLTTFLHEVKAPFLTTVHWQCDSFGQVAFTLRHSLASDEQYVHVTSRNASQSIRRSVFAVDDNISGAIQLCRGRRARTLTGVSQLDCAVLSYANTKPSLEAHRENRDKERQGDHTKVVLTRTHRTSSRNMMAHYHYVVITVDNNLHRGTTWRAHFPIVCMNFETTGPPRATWLE